jgi:hypothetical protein
VIWFDRTQRSVVVGCYSCGARDICLSQGAADNWAVDHVQSHDAEERARAVASLQERARRHAD